jgi:hypothetical protein
MKDESGIFCLNVGISNHAAWHQGSGNVKARILNSAFPSSTNEPCKFVVIIYKFAENIIIYKVDQKYLYSV